MADSNMEDIESNWVIVSDNIDVGEEAFESDSAENQLAKELEILENKEKSSENSETAENHLAEELEILENKEKSSENTETAENQLAEELDMLKNQEKSSENSETDSIGVLSETSSFQECGEHDEELIYQNEAVQWRFCEYVSPIKTEKEDNVSSSNQFYLNCLQEPVQELSENESDDGYACKECFGPYHFIEQLYDEPIENLPQFWNSDLRETFSRNPDSCDQLTSSNQSSPQQAQDLLVNDIALNHLSPNTEHANDHQEKSMEVANRTRHPTDQDRPCSLIKKYTNGILVGTILLALSSMFLGQYLKASESLDEDLPMYQEDIKEEFKESLEGLPVIQESYDVPTALTYCSDKHQSDDIYKELNIKKCLNKIDRRIQRAKEKEKILNREMYLEVKEKYLEQRERNLLRREYEVLQSELNLELKRSSKQQNFEENSYVDKENHEAVKNKNKRESMERKYKEDTTKIKENRKEINKKDDKPTKDYISRSVDLKEDVKYKQNKKMYKSKNTFVEEEKKKDKDSSKKRKNKDKYNENKYSKNESKRFETTYRNNYNKNDRQYKFERSGKLNENNNKFNGKKAKMGFDDFGKWYFDWMKGREVLRYIERYYSRI